MSLSFVIVDPQGLAPYVPQLRMLEEGISYPIEGGTDSFVIDHGLEYHPFFSEMGIKARFMLVRHHEKIVGSMAGVWKGNPRSEYDR